MCLSETVVYYDFHLGKNFTMTSFLCASKQALTHLEVSAFAKMHLAIINHGGISRDPKCGQGQLRTVDLKYVWCQCLHLYYSSGVIH